MRDVVLKDFKNLLFAEVKNKINLIKEELEGGDLIPTLFSDHFNLQVQNLGDVTYRDLARIAAQTIVHESCTEIPLTTQLVERLESRISAPVDRLRVLYTGLISIKQLLEAASNVSLTEECVVAVMKNGLYSGLDFSMKMCQVCGRETARFRPCVNTCKNVARDCLDRFRGISSLINELAIQLDRHRAKLTADVEGIFEVVEEWRADQENSGYFLDCVIIESDPTFDLKQGASLVFSSNPLQLHDIFRQSADYACWRSEAVEGDCWTAKGVTVMDSVKVLPFTTSNIPVTLSGQVDDVMITALESLQNSIKISEKVSRGESLLEPDSFTTTYMYTTDTRTVQQRSTSAEETRPPVSTRDSRSLATSATPSVAGQVDNLESIEPDSTGDTKTAEKVPTTTKQAQTTAEKVPITEKDPTTAEKDPTTAGKALTTAGKGLTTAGKGLTTAGKAPTTAGKAPTTTEKVPTTAEKVPPTIEKDPTTAEKDPTTAGKAPTTTEKVPTTAEKDPPTIEKHPTTAEKDPPTIEKDPTTAEKDPTTAGKAPTTAGKDPATSEKVPTTAEEVAKTAEQIPPTAEKIPTTAEKVSKTIKQAVSSEITTATAKLLPQSTEQADQSATTIDKSRQKSLATQNHVTKRQVTVEIEKDHVTNSTGQHVLTVQGDDDEEHGPTDELDKDSTQDRVTPAVANVSLSRPGNTSEVKVSTENPVVSSGSNEMNINSKSEDKAVNDTSVETTVHATEEVAQESVLPSEGSSNKSETTNKVAEKSASAKQKDVPVTEAVQSNTVDMKLDRTTERKTREVDKPASEFKNREEATKTDEDDQNISEEEEIDQNFPEYASPTNDQHVTTPKPTLAWDLEDDSKASPDSSSLTLDSKQMMSLVAICLGIFILTG